MKRAIIAAWLTLPLLAGAQSLGDAAKKERERRDKLKGSAAKPISDEELASNKGAIANSSKQAAEDAKPASEKAAGPVTVPLESEAPETRSTSGASSEAYWRAQAAQARQRIDQARRRYDAIDRMIRFGSGHKNEHGEVVIYSNQQLKAMGDKAEADVKAAEAAFERVVDDGRRAGALPGWFR